MRDLLVTTHTPALRSGQALRTYGVARALAAHRELDLLYARFGAPEPDAAFRAIERVSLHEVIPSRGARRLLSYAGARAGGMPDGFARGVSPELAASAEALAQDPERGRVIADGPIAAAALAQLARKRPVIYNAHNLESGFRHELDALADEYDAEGAHARMRAFERGLLERASECWMVSEADIAAARELCPLARLRYVPNVVDVEAIVPVQAARIGATSAEVGARAGTEAGAEAGAGHRAIFVASFTYEPNLDALHFMLEEILPRVWSELPDAELLLVGAGLEEPPSNDPRVRALGFVEDLPAAYAQAACAVVPLLTGGGSPLKFVEALAYGLPVVATPRAAAGLQVRDGEHCLLAADGEAFAAALVRVLRDGAPELGARGRELARERYSIEALSRLLTP